MGVISLIMFAKFTSVRSFIADLTDPKLDEALLPRGSKQNAKKVVPDFTTFKVGEAKRAGLKIEVQLPTIKSATALDFRLGDSSGEAPQFRLRARDGHGIEYGLDLRFPFTPSTEGVVTSFDTTKHVFTAVIAAKEASLAVPLSTTRSSVEEASASRQSAETPSPTLRATKLRPPKPSAYSKTEVRYHELLPLIGKEDQRLNDAMCADDTMVVRSRKPCSDFFQKFKWESPPADAMGAFTCTGILQCPPQYMTALEAKSACERVGARLCTISELEELSTVKDLGDCHSTSRAQSRVWSANACGVNMVMTTAMVSGAKDSRGKLIQSRCYPSTEKNIFARCCADGRHAASIRGKCIAERSLKRHKMASLLQCDDGEEGVEQQPRGSKRTCTSLALKKSLTTGFKRKCASNSRFSKCFDASGKRTHANARARCEFYGMRLCTASELRININGVVAEPSPLVKKTSFCGDGKLVWSSTPCKIRGNESLQAFATFVGRYDPTILQKSAYITETCTPAYQTAFHRCCADTSLPSCQPDEAPLTEDSMLLAADKIAKTIWEERACENNRLSLECAAPISKKEKVEFWEFSHEHFSVPPIAMHASTSRLFQSQFDLHVRHSNPSNPLRSRHDPARHCDAIHKAHSGSGRWSVGGGVWRKGIFSPQGCWNLLFTHPEVNEANVCLGGTDTNIAFIGGEAARCA